MKTTVILCALLLVAVTAWAQISGGSGGGTGVNGGTVSMNGVITGGSNSNAFNSTNTAGNTMNNAFIVNNHSGTGNNAIDLEVKNDTSDNLSFVQLDATAGSGGIPQLYGANDSGVGVGGACGVFAVSSSNYLQTFAQLKVCDGSSTFPSQMQLFSHTGDFEFDSDPAGGHTIAASILRGYPPAALVFDMDEISAADAPGGSAARTKIWDDATAHRLKMNNNNGGAAIVQGAQVLTVGTLPGCAAGTAGMDLSVSDSDTQTWGATCVHTSGALAAGCHCDGTNWTVYAK